MWEYQNLSRRFCGSGAVAGFSLDSGHPNLGCPALLAEGYAIFYAGPTLMTGMFHRNSRYRRLRDQARKPTGKIEGARIE